MQTKSYEDIYTNKVAHTHKCTHPSYNLPHTSAIKKLHKSFKLSTQETSYLLSADAAIWTGKRKDRPQLFLLCDLQKQDVALTVLCKNAATGAQQNLTNLSSSYVLLCMYYHDKTKWGNALNCSERP